MKVCFVYLTENPGGDEHLGTASIASYLEKHGISVELKLIVYHPDKYEEAYQQIPKDGAIIGFPLYHTNALFIYGLAKKIKAEYPSMYISVGGPLATDAFSLIFQDSQHIDFVVLGDGEEPYLTAVQALQNGRDLQGIPSLVTRQTKNDTTHLQINLTHVETNPWVSRQYLEQMIDRGFGTARVSAARGCCANCSFCSHNNYTKHQGKQWRGRDIHDVFNEIVYIHQTYGITSFTFNDGSFEDPGRVGKARIREFCQLVLDYPYRLHFWCFLRADTFREEDKPLILLMRKAGFTEVFIGLESQNEQDLAFYNKRASRQENLYSLKLFQRCGIHVLFGFIMFNPITTVRALRENYEFLKQIKTWRPHAYVGNLAVYYQTDAHKKCKEMGLLTDEFSYINPYGYKFLQEDVSRIWSFTERYLHSSRVVQQYDFDLFYFNNFIFDLLALFPEPMESFIVKYQRLMDETAQILADYFRYIYVDGDLGAALDHLPLLEKAMENQILKINSLKLKILLKEPIRSTYTQQFENSRRH